MANWVVNSLQFNTREDFEKALRLLDIENEKDFSFERFVPQPKTREETPPEYILGKDDMIAVEDEHPWLDWYKWNTANWGVKWDCSEVSFGASGLTFWTPNGIAVPVFRKMAKVWKDFDFEIDFCEEQMYPAGYAQHAAGTESLGVVCYEPESDECYEAYNDLWGEGFEKGSDGEWHSIDVDDD